LKKTVPHRKKWNLINVGPSIRPQGLDDNPKLINIGPAYRAFTIDFQCSKKKMEFNKT
jgi:hypothetical protein